MEKSEFLDEPTDGQKCCIGSTSSRSECYTPKRYVVIALLFLGMVICNAQRVNIGVTVIEFLEKAPLSNREDCTSNICKLNWSHQKVGFLHAIFYIGLFISQIPFGYLVTTFASHRLFGGCVLFTCLANLLIPLSISTPVLSYGFTCFIRLLQGLIEGVLYPSCYDVLRIWSLPEEKSRMGATVLTGSYIGPTIGMVVSGLLTDYCGWVYVFYAHGLAGVIWFCFWAFLAYERPCLHPTISIDERKLIETRQGEVALIYEHGKVPWGAIFTSLPVYALIICNFARSFVFYMLLTNQPMYFYVLRFTIAETGVYSSLPYAVMALFCIFSGMLADFMMSKPWLSHTFVRKMFTSVGYGAEAAFFFALALIEDRYMAVVFLTLGVGLSGIAIAGWQINHLDLAPRYAGILVAITMTFGTLAGVFNPLIVAAMTHDKTLTGWHNVFWLTGCIIAGAAIFYLVFGSGDRQSWAVPKPPPQQVISKGDPLASKPYGTFPAQLRSPSLTLETKDKPADIDTTSALDDPSKTHTTEFNGNASEYADTTRRRPEANKMEET